MRPVRRGSPNTADFDNYKDAKPDLVTKIGSYCSYCERHIATLLAVEHIQPKGLPQWQHLQGKWQNFLLGCTNCNSVKRDKNVLLFDILLPDRDNTFLAFRYLNSGEIGIAGKLANTPLQALAMATLKLTGLTTLNQATDNNGRSVALDRISQRREAWQQAEIALNDLLHSPSEALKRSITREAVATGFFSVWMTVFAAQPDMLLRFIRAFPGTQESGCFDMQSGQPVSPAPNPDQLAHGGKI